jgi:hypothetical protein
MALAAAAPTSTTTAATATARPGLQYFFIFIFYTGTLRTICANTRAEVQPKMQDGRAKKCTMKHKIRT